MLLSKTLSYYKRKEIRELLVKYAKDKEVAVRFKDFFGKRPDSLQYPNDVLELAKRKATSFHCSEELWSNPLSLRSDMKRKEQDELRIGWDLILDIDCSHFIYSKLATHILIKILKEEGLEAITCKFSGNKGFHIAVPFEAFPQKINGELTENLFPEAPRRIALYLRERLKPLLEKAILKVEKNNIDNVIKRTGLSYKELVQTTKDGKGNVTEYTLDSERFLEIDTILIASRHLYRMPYSLHEKSGLVSVPIDINNVLKFKKAFAEPDKVSLDVPFLVRDVKKDQAAQFVLNAFDYNPIEKRDVQETKTFDVPDEAIPEEFFPPTIKNILKGLKDGRKRALFTLINFLKGVGYDPPSIEQKIKEWNERNDEPLREVYLKGQISQLKKQKEAIPPHNYPHAGDNYYKDLRVYEPDALEKKVKNPIQYAKIKAGKNKKGKGGRKKLTPEQKEMRRKFREKKKKSKD